MNDAMLRIEKGKNINLKDKKSNKKENIQNYMKGFLLDKKTFNTGNIESTTGILFLFRKKDYIISSELVHAYKFRSIKKRKTIY